MHWELTAHSTRGVRDGRNSSRRSRVERLEPRRLLSVSVTTYHVDGMRTGVNAAETVLAPTNVKSTTFGKLFSDTLDGNVFAQPLYLPGVSVPGKGTHDVVFVATEHDSVYAFDAAAPGAPLWQASFIDPAHGVTTVPSADQNSFDTYPEAGITGTPVIDPASGTLYVVAKTKEVSGSTVNFVQKLHALDVTTGAEKFGGPVVIQPSVTGSGDGSVGGTIAFNARTQNQRPGLALTNGKVYVSWASHADHAPSHGWLVGYDVATLQQKDVFNFSPNGTLDGVWQSGGAPAVDAGGDLFLNTGNGTFDANTGGPDWGETAFRFNTAGPLAVKDWFTPTNWQFLNQVDQDLGSGGVLLLPDQPGAHPHEALFGGKAGVLYLADRDNLGHFDAATDHVLQKFTSPGSGIYSTPAYFNGAVYVAANNDKLRRYTLSNGVMNTTPASTSANQFGFAGTNPAISANGTSNGIVWSLSYGTNGVLRAYDAGDVSKQLYASTDAGSRDTPVGGVMKFQTPVVADGHVFVAGGGQFTVYGLLGQTAAKPAAPTAATATAVAPTQVNLAWKANSSNEQGFKILRSAAGGAYALIDTAAAGATTYSDTHAAGNQSYTYQVVATNTAGDSSPATTNAVTTPPPVAVDPSLTGWWKFEEGTGPTTADATPDGHGGALTGEVTWIAGKVGTTALGFHGTGQIASYVDVADAPDLRFTASQSFTLGAWVNPSTPPGKLVGVITKAADSAAGFGIYETADGLWQFSGPAGSITGPAAVTGWHYLAAVQDGAANTRTFYVDGTAVGAGPAQDASGAGDLYFGGSEGTTDQYWPGALDDIRLYSRALSAAEVTAISGQAPPPAPGTLNATDDAYVRDGAYASTNYGAPTQLLVKAAVANGGYVRNAYVRFDLSGEQNVTAAKLRLYGGITPGSPESSITLKVYPVPNAGWNESAITYNNAPPPAAAPIASVTVTGTTPNWYEIDLTNYLFSLQSSGEPVVAFALKGTTSTTGSVTFNSREATANTPQLVYTTASASVPAKPLSASAAVVSSTRVNVTWQPGSTNATGFKIFRSTDNSNYTSIRTVPVDTEGDDDTAQVYSDLTVLPGKTYYYKVVASNDIGDSPPKSAGSVTTPAGSGGGGSGGGGGTGGGGGGGTTTTTVAPAGDGYVRDGSYAGTKFGTATDLQVKKATAGYTRVSYLLFDLSGLTTLSSAKLRLFGNLQASTATTGVGVSIFGVSSTTWDEKTLTNSNAPPADANAQASATVTGGAAKYYEFDLAAYLNQQLAAGKTKAAVAIKATAVNTNFVDFNSHEATTNPPQLMVTR